MDKMMTPVLLSTRSRRFYEARRLNAHHSLCIGIDDVEQEGEEL